MNNIFYKLEKYNHKYHSAVTKKQNYKLPLYTNHKVKYLKELLNNTKILMKGGVFNKDQLEKANAAAKGRYDALLASDVAKQAQIDALNTEVARLGADLATKDAEIATKDAEIATKDVDIDRLNTQVRQVQVELQRLTQAAEDARAAGDQNVEAIQTQLDAVRAEKDELTQELETSQQEKEMLREEKTRLEQDITAERQQIALANTKLQNALGKYNVLYKDLLDSIKDSFSKGIYDEEQIRGIFEGDDADAEIAYVLGDEAAAVPIKNLEFFAQE